MVPQRRAVGTGGVLRPYLYASSTLSEPFFYPTRALRRTPMKYFTNAWRNGKLTDREIQSVRDRYWRHIERLRPALPDTVLDLAYTMLSGARVRRADFDESSRELTLVLRLEGAEENASDFEIWYGGAEVVQENLDALAEIISGRDAEVLDHEIDATRNGFVHCLIFRPTEEVEIGFSRLELRMRGVGDEGRSGNGKVRSEADRKKRGRAAVQ